MDARQTFWREIYAYYLPGTYRAGAIGLAICHVEAQAAEATAESPTAALPDTEAT